MKIELKGNTSQESTTGKNLFDISKVLTNGTALVNNGNGTITVTTASNNSQVVASEPRKLKDYCPNLQVGDSVYLTANSTGTNKYIYLATTAQVWTFGTQRTITQNDLDSTVGWYASGVSTTATINNLMISTSGGDYEPYTGGNPAPNPDYPYPVNVVTGDNEVKVEGKNLFNGSLFVNETVTGITLSHNDKGEIVLNGTSTAQTSFNAYYFDIPESWTQLVLSGGTTNVSFSILTYTSGGTYISQTRDSGSGATYTIPSNATKYALNIKIASGVTLSNYVLKAQLKKDTSTTEYEPHQEQTYPINLGSMELCKIGDYQDRIYKDNGKWYVEKNTRKLELAIADMDNNEDYPGWKNVRDLLNDYPNKNSLLSNFTDYMCNITNKNNVISANTKQLSGGGILFFNKAIIALTQTQWKEQYPNLVVELYYGITPTTTEITDTTLIEQLDNLEKAYSYDTQTNISQDNDDLPFILDVTALKKNSSN